MATWTPSASSNLAGQALQLYDGPLCDLPLGNAMVLNASTNFQSLNVLPGHRYTFRVASTDGATLVTPSVCSPSIEVLVTTPEPTLPATGLGWRESSPSFTIHITAQWMPSTSSGVIRQEVQFFQDGACVAALGSPVSLSMTANTLELTGSVGATYSYQVTTYGSDGQSPGSTCSPAIFIQCADPFDLQCGGGTGV